MSELKELKVIYPEKTKVLFGDKEVEIKTIPFGKLPYMAELADKVIEKLEKNKASGDLGIAKALFEIIKTDLDLITTALTITTSLEKKEIEEMSLQAASFILSNVIEVNASFLSEKVFPELKAMATVMNKKK